MKDLYCLRQCASGEPVVTPKTEVLEVRERPVFADLADVQTSVANYFNYYNHKRLHSSIDYQTSYYTYQQFLQLSA